MKFVKLENYFGGAVASARLGIWFGGKACEF